MSKKLSCQFCGNYSGKSDTCKNCKEKTPYQPAGKKGIPFNRIDELTKLEKR